MSQERLLDLIERIGTVLGGSARGAAATHGLLPVHLQILRYLARCNRFSDTPAAVTAYLGSTKGTVSQSLRVLDREGLIERRGDPDDRRVVHLRTSRRGRDALDRAARETAREQRLALDPRATADAIAVLESLLRQLQRSNQRRTFGACGTCRHLIREGGTRLRCGLTREPLSADDTTRICIEHEPPPAAA